MQLGASPWIRSLVASTLLLAAASACCESTRTATASAASFPTHGKRNKVRPRKGDARVGTNDQFVDFALLGTPAREATPHERRTLAVFTKVEDGDIPVEIDSDDVLVVQAPTLERAVQTRRPEVAKKCSGRPLCDGELSMFREQPVAAACSAVALGPRIIATASHCYTDFIEKAAEAFFVMDYRAGATPDQHGIVELRVPQERWFRAKYLDHGRPGEGEWALLCAEERALPFDVVEFANPTKEPEPGDVRLYAFPSRLPLTRSGNWTAVRRHSDVEYRGFFARLEGSSGGPAFVGETLFGVLSGSFGSERHWREDGAGRCCRTTRCENPGDPYSPWRRCAYARIVPAQAFAAKVARYRETCEERAKSEASVRRSEQL